LYINRVLLNKKKKKVRKGKAQHEPPIKVSRKLERATKGKNYAKLISETTGSTYTKRQAQTELTQQRGSPPD